MQKVILKITLLSETIFGSGRTVPGDVDLEIVHDEYGLPYFKGKTFKGKFREALEQLDFFVEEDRLSNEIDHLLGKPGDGVEGILKFSDCEINEGMKAYLVEGIKQGIITPDEIKQSLTQVRKSTSINENGVAQAGSLREYRVINSGLELFCKVVSEEKLSDYQLGILAMTAKMLRKIGSMGNRGKGRVDISLWVGGKNKTQDYIDLFMREVQN